MNQQKVVVQATVLIGFMGVVGTAIIGSPWTLREAFDAALWIGGLIAACSVAGCHFAEKRELREQREKMARLAWEERNPHWELDDMLECERLRNEPEQFDLY